MERSTSSFYHSTVNFYQIWHATNAKMFIIQCPILWYAKVCALPSAHSSCTCFECGIDEHCPYIVQFRWSVVRAVRRRFLNSYSTFLEGSTVEGDMEVEISYGGITDSAEHDCMYSMWVLEDFLGSSHWFPASFGLNDEVSSEQFVKKTTATTLKFIPRTLLTVRHGCLFSLTQTHLQRDQRWAEFGVTHWLPVCVEPNSSLNAGQEPESAEGGLIFNTPHQRRHAWALYPRKQDTAWLINR